MKGFIIFQNETGQLLYSKNYNSMPFTQSQNIPIDQSLGDTKSTILKGSNSQGKNDKSIQKKRGSNLVASDSSIFNNNENITINNKFSKESVDYSNNHIDNQDPQDLANKFHGLMLISRMMGEEFKEMYPKQYNEDPTTKKGFVDGFTQFKSDSTDHVLQHCAHYPLTLILFYDNSIYLESIIRGLAIKILDVFLYKYESKFQQDDYYDYTPQNDNQKQINVEEAYQKFDFSVNPGTTFESCLPYIYEDSLVDYIKHLYVSLNTYSFQIPWIYIIQNKELCGRENKYMDPNFDKEHNDAQKLKEKKKKEMEQSQFDKKSSSQTQEQFNAKSSTAKSSVSEKDTKVKSSKDQSEAKEQEKSEKSGVTRKTTGSKKSNTSKKSDKSDKYQRYRDKFETERAVDEYKKNKDIDHFEKEFEYKSDEESIFGSFQHDPKLMANNMTKRFGTSTESHSNKRIAKDVLKRFNEKTQTYEFILKFNNNIEKTDESSIQLNGTQIGEIIDQKERRRYVRKEIKCFEETDVFSHSLQQIEKNLFGPLIDMFTKANQLINILYRDQHAKYLVDRAKMEKMDATQKANYKKNNYIYDGEPPVDHLKYIEMQLNKKNLILDKAKMVCLKLDKIFLILPYTSSKIEIRMRNVMINNRSLLDGISHFMNFYLVNQEFHMHILNKYTQHRKIQQEIDYEEKFKKKGSNKNLNSSSTALLGQSSGAQVGVTHATNYSSNMQPIASGSQMNIQSESIINVAVGESAFVNSNVGITMEKH